MDEIYVNEKYIPQNCDRCKCYYYDKTDDDFFVKTCRFTDESTPDNVRAVNCPFRSIEQHDNELRQKYFHEGYEQGKFDAQADLGWGVHDSEVRAKAIKEFAEKLKARKQCEEGGFVGETWQHDYVDIDDIDELVKETTEYDC